ncbi:MAG: MATE family efflux transporter [Clostridium sp.]|uniref:MATE family efflux transporter n=1 Tax=Clostridium sp. TaxID=1506 RepID=UPI0030312DC2
MMKDKRCFILEGNLYKVIGVLALPIMINNLIQTLYNLVDGLWVSKIGSVEFAATAFVWPVNFLFISIGIGLSIAGTSIISQFIGANRYDEAKKYASQLIVISFLTSLVFMVVGYFLTPFIVRVMGGTGDLAKFSTIYLRINFLDLPFMFLFFNFNSIMNAQGNTVLPTALSGISAIINIVLDPIFIFTFNMGIAGAAIATLLAKAILAMAGLYILMKKSSKIRPAFRNFKFNKVVIKRILSIAIPSSIGQSGAALGFMVLNGFIVSYGTATLAAFAMVNRITALIMQPAMGVGSALTSIVGQNLGCNKLARAKDAFIASMKLTIGFSAVGVFILLAFDNQIINFFMQSKDDMGVISQALTFLQYISWSMPLMGIFSVLQGVFQGSGHTRYSMEMEIGRLWFVRLPMILIFKNFTQIGEVGIWFSMSFSNLIICIFGYMLYRKGAWEKSLIHNECCTEVEGDSVN